jgi:quinoprotein glucose dehydrogenase
VRKLFLPSVAVALLTGALTANAAAPGDWPNVFNDKQGTRYSKLDQINRVNVHKLQVAWIYHTGDAGETTTIECTPVVADGLMFVTTVTSKVVALDPETGKQVWTFDPYAGPVVKRPRASGGVNRGVAYWSDGKENGQRRVILGVADGRLVSLDARNGKPDASFADSGTLDLRKGITERDISTMAYGPTSAPLVFENLVIVGCSNDEGHPGAPGDPRAFDVRSGKEVWRFHTVPWPGEFGHDTWEPSDAYKNRGGANPWGGLTLDPDKGVLFCGTGSAGPDFYGAGRKGANLFANCVLALDARTGKRLWHFQTTHHDMWDHDNPCPPVVTTVTHNGRKVPAVAQVTKTGYCYVLHAETGEPLFGVREVPAPPSDVPGEQAHPTQPEPLKPPPLSYLEFTKDHASDILPQTRRYVLDKLKEYRHDRLAPPSLRGTVVTPGFHGGATWSGASFDPTTGWLYVNTNNTPYLAAVKKHAEDDYRLTGYGVFRDADGYPAVKPPWGQLTAIDLNTGDFAWRIPLGEHPELTKRGVPQTGTENFGGTIVTAGGLVFIGGTMDEKFHAFDKSTGKLLWEYQLPAGGYATPCTYEANGKQYVVIAAGGGGKLRTRSGDSFVAFALPAP